ncbi:sigma-70 family RNA polymerase sigma factor [Streptomyces sp. NPDC018036]|uniref:sigma-70 family RNA polymerase sigma factor n=1 Tax=Streptomyces sp. NPDC018036 TaxID=3365035 RepID=UPI0037A8C567
MKAGSHRRGLTRQRRRQRRLNITLVQYAAGRFGSRGQDEMEDIVQVGTIGLIKAIDRFELSREVEFTSFAVPYIVGEIKRFFRDTTWAVHVPRDGETALADFIGVNDNALELVEDFHALAPLIAQLDDRERRIIHMRFVDELTQAQIGEHLGISQMHVSRLLGRTLAKLREGMLTTN